MMSTSTEIQELMVRISPCYIHDDSLDMQIALEKFGDTDMLDIYKEIQSKSKRLNRLVTIYLNNRPEDGKVPWQHKLYKLYCKILWNNSLLGELFLKYVTLYNIYAEQYDLLKY